MPLISAPSFALPSKGFPGQTVGLPSGIVGELTASELLGRYSHLCKAGRIQIATATLAASSPVVYTTNTLTGGPFIWNKPNSNQEAYLLGMSVAVATAASTGTSGGIGITTGSGQTTTPTATTPIDAIANAYQGGTSSAMNVYRTATPSAAGTTFLPTINISLAATTAMFAPSWVDLCGSICVPEGTWASVAASATQTNLVAIVALMWAELPF